MFEFISPFSLPTIAVASGSPLLLPQTFSVCTTARVIDSVRPVFGTYILIFRSPLSPTDTIHTPLTYEPPYPPLMDHHPCLWSSLWNINIPAVRNSVNPLKPFTKGPRGPLCRSVSVRSSTLVSTTTRPRLRCYFRRPFRRPVKRHRKLALTASLDECNARPDLQTA